MNDDLMEEPLEDSDARTKAGHVFFNMSAAIDEVAAADPIPMGEQAGEEQIGDGHSSWSQWTWNAELGLYIIFYDECYHTWDPEKQIYGKYSQEEEDDSKREDSLSASDNSLGIDGEPMSDSELDGEPLNSDDFKEGVSISDD